MNKAFFKRALILDSASSEIDTKMCDKIAKININATFA